MIDMDKVLATSIANLVLNDLQLQKQKTRKLLNGIQKDLLTRLSVITKNIERVLREEHRNDKVLL